MREFDGVDFAILMAFASEPLANRQHEPTQQTYRRKLRTQTAQETLAELVEPHGRGGPGSRFVRRIAGVPESFP